MNDEDGFAVASYNAPSSNAYIRTANCNGDGEVMGASLPKDITGPSSVEFGELGVVLEMMWRGEQGGLKRCAFCRTLNHHRALRCAVCSSVLVQQARSDSRIASRGWEVSAGEPRSVDAIRRVRREFLNTLFWTVAMPVVLSLGFLCWNAYREARAAPTSQFIMKNAQAEHLHSKAVPASALEEPQGLERRASSAGLGLGVDRSSEVLTVDPGPPRPAGPSPAARKPQSRVAVHSPSPLGRDSSRKVEAVANRSPPDITASCQGEMFLLRAICINEQCAKRQNAGQPSCAEPIRQRRIDEARRNPMLAG